MTWITKYKHYLKGKTATGVDLTWQNDDSIVANVVVLSKKNNIIEVLHQHTNIKSFEELFSLINPVNPVLLSIDGKGVVHKPVEANTDNEPDISKLVSQVFPNFSESEFYVQHELINNNELFLTIARNEFIVKSVQPFLDEKFLIYNITLGPFILNRVANLFNGYNTLLISSGKVSLTGGIISKLEKSDSDKSLEYNIAEEKINNKLILAYITAFTFFIDENKVVNNEVTNYRNDYLYKRAFVLLGYSAVAFIFIILLLNFVLLDKYNKLLSDNLIDYNRKKDLAAQLASLKKEVAVKESFILGNKFLETSRSSFYADRIAYLMPEGIRLNELFIFPFEKRIRAKESLQFKNSLIFISGVASSAKVLNEWFSKLRNEKWVKELNLSNFRQGEKRNETEFEIEINIQ